MTITDDEAEVIFDAEFRYDDSPFSSSTTDNWVARAGGLPPYIRAVTRGVMKSGHSFTEALQIAIGVMRIWSTGHNPWSKNHAGHVTPEVQAKATAALAHWEAMKASHGRSIAIRAGSSTGMAGVSASASAPVSKSSSSSKSSGSKSGSGTAKGSHAAGHPFYGNQHTKPGGNPLNKGVPIGGKGGSTKPQPTGGGGGGGGGGAGAAASKAAAAAAAQAAKTAAVTAAKNAYTNAKDANDAATQHLAQTQDQATQDLAFAQERIKNTASASANAASAQSIEAVKLSTQQRIENAQTALKASDDRLGQAQQTLEAAMKAAGFRSDEIEIEVRDGFIGEGGTSGASNFLPVGPSAKQAKAVDDALAAKGTHRFVGSDLSRCGKCGQPVTASVHRKSGRKLSATAAGGAAQPIPPVPREAVLLRHRGPGHAPVSTGHVKGVPARHKAAAYAANQKNFATVDEPLTAALQAHFGEQHRATMNRLLGKRGGRMLRRAADDQAKRPIVPPPPAGVVVPPKYPAVGDETHTTEEWSTIPSKSLEGETAPTSVADQQEALGESVEAAAIRPVPDDVEADIAPAETAAKAVDVPSVSVEAPEDVPDLDPQEIFDQRFWTDKLAQVIQPHLNTAAQLAQGEVKHQVGLPVEADDTHSLSAVQSILKRKAAEIAQAVTGTTARDLAGALQEGVANGEGRDAIAKRVDAVFANADAVRAKQIAQTSTVGAYNESATVYAQNLPPETVGDKVWLAHKDDRTRPTHKMADGQHRPLNAPFIVGGSPMMQPGDTTAPIGEWINCRCSQSFLPPGMTYGPIASAAEAYVAALRAKPPAPVSPYPVAS